MIYLNYIILLFGLMLLPAILLGVFWGYVMKRGWGSKWLLATSIAVCLLLMSMLVSLAAQESSVFFWGLGLSTFSGIVFYIYLRTSPQGDILIGQNQQMQNSWAALSEEDRIARRQSTKLMLQDIFLVSVLQNAPIILGAAIMILPKEKSALTHGLGAFMIGVSGILRIVMRPKNVPSELYGSKSRIIGNILLTAFAWSFAIYTLFQGLASP